MATANRDDRWVRRVGAVFNTRPRIGVGRKTVWLSRDGYVNDLLDSFQRAGSHVCLDGPSGVGKTSLAWTFLVTNSIPYVNVQLTSKMTWPEFCRQLMTLPDNRESAFGVDAEVGIDKGLPVGKLRVSIGRKGRASDDVDLITKHANSWTEHDVAESLCDAGAALLIDDTERATSDLLTRLSDLAKILTQRDAPENAKILFVGTEDIYRRICHHNASLDERILQVSLGGFRSPKHSWSFLKLGFERLGLRHPGNSFISSEFAQLDSCIDAVYEAADGLPKTLNMLGQEIALRATSSNAVNASEVKERAALMTRANWRKYGEDFPRVLERVDQSPEARAVIRVLYEVGIARIHRFDDIYKRVRAYAEAQGSTATRNGVDEALDELVEVDFLVRTGRSREIIYTTQPTAAHTLGVMVRDEARFASMRLREPQAVAGSFPKQLSEPDAPENEG